MRNEGIFWGNGNISYLVLGRWFHTYIELLKPSNSTLKIDQSLYGIQLELGRKSFLCDGKGEKIYAKISPWNGSTYVFLHGREDGRYIEHGRDETMVLEASHLWVQPSPATLLLLLAV